MKCCITFSLIPKCQYTLHFSNAFLYGCSLSLSHPYCLPSIYLHTRTYINMYIFMYIAFCNHLRVNCRCDTPLTLYVPKYFSVCFLQVQSFLYIIKLQLSKFIMRLIFIQYYYLTSSLTQFSQIVLITSFILKENLGSLFAFSYTF